jgi:predicted  nucleic acid-binding Zn-ribbon protein
MGKKPKKCSVCREITSIKELVECDGKCNSCFGAIPSDDSEDECKELRKRIRKLEKTVEKLSDKLLIQETKVFGIEKMIEGFILGMKSVGNDNANIEELSDDAF